MKCTIGINANHADSSSVIFLDNKLIFGIEEERLNRIKHWSGLPLKSLNLCLNIAKQNNIKNIDIAVNSNTFSNFSQKLIYALKNYMFGSKKFEILERHKKKFSITKEIKQNFKNFNFNLKYIDHHLSHLASAYYPSNYDSAYAISIDGFGDFSSIVVAKCKGSEINIIKKIFFPNSLGVFYEGFTQFLGFRNYGDEYKLMGLSCYGKPIYKDIILKEIFRDKKKFELNLDYFNHHKKEFSYNFSGVPNQNQIINYKKIKFFDQSKLDYKKNFQYIADIASSVQSVFETLLGQLIDDIKKDNFSDNLVLAGGCALNSLANGKLLESKKFKNIFVPYSPGDSGGAIGACLINIKDKQKNIKFENVSCPYIGTNYNNENIQYILNKIDKSKLEILKLNEPELIDRINELIIKSFIIGHFRGRMEFGPRSLGNRAILANPMNPEIRNIINQKIKRRENFRPFAPVMLEEFKKEWFISKNQNPYMSFVETIVKDKQKLIPAVTHVDGTGRVQTVNRKENEFLHKLIYNFYEKTNVPVLLNTSFNENEPMVENPEQALDCFLRTDMDALVLENFIILKK